MTNALWDPGREGFSLAELDWDADDFRVILIKSTYTFNSAHKFLSDLGAVDNGRSATLTGTVAPSGVHDANDTTLTATTAVPCNAIAVFKHTGLDTTARLVAYMDTMTGLPFTPAAGGTINIQWSDGANKIFKL